jgi:hypothetical protein
MKPPDGSDGVARLRERERGEEEKREEMRKKGLHSSLKP